ncbi:MAG: hypothetical protein DME18_11805 [Verrucomicrobia bacterium]|nr:MAG: hypothetical protein DME18_11805 [Verrucomicrobiota bacterium]
MNVSSFKVGRTVPSPPELKPRWRRLPACLRRARCLSHSAAPPRAKVRAKMTNFAKCGAVEHCALPARLLDIIIVVLTMAAPCRVLSQEARLVNAQTQTRAVASGLEKEFRSLVKNQVEPAWIGYAVPAVEGNHHICCTSSEDRHVPASFRHGRCKLEGRDDGMNFQTNSESDEGERSDYLLVLFRVAGASVGKIRVFTDDCELDAGGLPVYWLTDVKLKESIDLLASFVGGTEAGTKAGRRQSESAIAAIALHADSAADRALGKFVDSGRAEEVRKNTAFWLGNLRGQKGYEILRRMVREDPSDKVREHCTFALHISKVPEAVNAMIDAARNDTSAHVRGQALFWLSQKAGEKAAKAISDAIQNDPETDVKKKAVFALSQLPKDQGVPKLILAARSNRNKEVRKDAMFWLGQSNDPRALSFFEEVLTH